MTKHILVVDDDPTVQKLIAEYLSINDFRVSTASDGEGMAKALADTIVDLIVLDLKLAKEDGLGLLRQLRSHSDVPRSRVPRGVAGIPLTVLEYESLSAGFRPLPHILAVVGNSCSSSPPS